MTHNGRTVSLRGGVVSSQDGRNYVLELPERFVDIHGEYKILLTHAVINSLQDPDKVLHEDSWVIVVELPDAGLT